MEYAVITDGRGERKIVNPSDRVAVQSAIMAITGNWGLAEYYVEWCEIACAGMMDATNLPNIPYVQVEIATN